MTRVAAQPIRRLTAAVVVVATAIAAAGCGDGASGRGDRVLHVSVATSLREAMTRIADDFTASHPDVEVVLNLDSSSVLATQIVEGAPAEVFASADEASMDRLDDEGRLAAPARLFAGNELVVVTRPGNPEGVASLSDLEGVDVVALCGEDAPCGRYAAAALASAGVSIDESSITRGRNVGATLRAVTHGDAVAAIVYATDARNAGVAVEVIPIPPEHAVEVRYPIAVLADVDAPELAEAFVAHVLGDEGQTVLAQLGFLAP